MNLSFLILIPFLTLLALLAGNGAQFSRMIAAVGMTIQLGLSVFLAFAYCAERTAGNTTTMLFQTEVSWFKPLGINYHVGVDGISIAMILLTAIVMLAGVLISWNIEKMTKEFFILFMLLGAGAFGFFMSLDLFALFFFFELAVIPKYLLIAIWGSGRKEFFAMKLALMLMAGSALALVGIFGIHFNSAAADGTMSWNLIEIGKVHIPIAAQRLFFPLTFIGFGVISALFPFHTWAPDGHSSAPTAASMFLAGISMKLGGYGCLRVAIYLMPEAAKEYAPIIITLAVIGILYGAFATVKQTDLKYMNAYSSVSHCGFVILGIGMLTKTAATGAVLQMVSHGLMTALFFAVIGMVYDRSHTRIGAQMGGLLKVIPFIGTAFIISGLCSLGLPGLSGFVAEMNVLTGAFEVNSMYPRIITLLAACSLVVTSVYILRMTGLVMLGPLKKEEFRNFKDARWTERLASYILIVAIIGMGVLPFWLSGMISDSMGGIFDNLHLLAGN